MRTAMLSGFFMPSAICLMLCQCAWQVGVERAADPWRAEEFAMASQAQAVTLAAAASAKPPLSADELNQRTYFGVTLAMSENLPQDAPYRAEFGLVVRSVSPGFPAWAAGVRAGDVLLAMNGEDAAFLGAGMVIDANGNDVYRAHTYAQGTSFMGIAALVDAAGDDRYESHLYSQAAGIAGGVAALIDGQGHDRYVATGFFPSGYGTPGTFGGWSQGVGIGLRSLVSGGIGMLYDGGGRDVMEGGDFSQGGGYYFGWGILDAAGTEDDVYVGTRYAQGFAAHSALGTFIEAGGNDFYESRSGVSTGNAWDLSITWFEDQGGDDRYPAQVFSTGSSAHNSLCVFIDAGGNDRYEGNRPPANNQCNGYHGGTSLSLYFSFGAGHTRYQVPFQMPAEANGEYSFLFRVEGGFTQLLGGNYLESILGPIASQR